MFSPPNDSLNYYETAPECTIPRADTDKIFGRVTSYTKPMRRSLLRLLVPYNRLVRKFYQYHPLEWCILVQFHSYTCWRLNSKPAQCCRHIMPTALYRYQYHKQYSPTMTTRTHSYEHNTTAVCTESSVWRQISKTKWYGHEISSHSHS